MTGTTTDVRFTSDGLTLRGTLRRPVGDAPAPAVLLVPGSGPVNRDSDHPKLPLGVTRRLADALAAVGIASLRFDKRGVGDSDGDFLRAGLHDNVADARAALDALRAADGVDVDRVLVVGHSEGAVIAAAVGAEDTHLAGVVLLSGSARSGADTMRWQLQAIAPTLPRAARAVLRLLRIDLAKKQQRTFAKVRGSDADVMRLDGRKTNARWLREYLDADPATWLRRITVPVLAVTGDKDLQVPAEDVEAIGDLVGGPFTGHVVADVNHILRPTPGTPDLKAYKAQAREPLDPRVVDHLVTWARAVIGLDPAGGATDGTVEPTNAG